MKASVLTLAVLVLCLAATPAVAQEDLYDNGPTNGQSLGFNINFGFVTSDQFTLGSGATVNGLTFAAWLFGGDALETAEVSITSSEFGGTSFFDQTVSFTSSGCFSNFDGFNVCSETGAFRGVNLNRGSYWLNLQNAVTQGGEPAFWDMNSGPSPASFNSLGTIPSESFTILGNSDGTGTTSGGSSPEPSGIVLFGSGVLGVAGWLRRKLL